MSDALTGTAPSRTRAAFVLLFASYAGNAITIVKGIVLVPLYLRLLGIETYGAWLASGNVAGLLGLLDSGIGSALQQRLGEAWGASDRARFVRLTGAGATAAVAIFGSMAIVGVAIARFVPGWVNAPANSTRELAIAFAMAAIGAAETVAMGAILSVSAAWQEAIVAGTSRIVGQLIEIILIVYGLLSGWGVLALGAGSIGGATGALAIAATWTMMRWSSNSLGFPSAERREVFELFKTSGPLAISRVLLQVDANIEVAMVSAFINPAAAAVYAITDRILKAAMGFIIPIANSVSAGLSHYAGERGRLSAMRPAEELVSLWSLVVAAVLPALFALNQDFVSVWVGFARFGGVPLTAAFFGSEVLGSRELLLSVFLASMGGLQAAGWVASAEVATRLPLMALGLFWMGSIGIPLATAAVSIAFLFATGSVISRWMQLGQGGVRRLVVAGWAPVAAAFALAAAETRWAPHATGWGSLVLKGLCVGGFHLTLALLLVPHGRRTLWSRLAVLRTRGLSPNEPRHDGEPPPAPQSRG